MIPGNAPENSTINALVEPIQNKPAAVDLNTALMAYLMYSAQVNQDIALTKSLIQAFIKLLEEIDTDKMIDGDSLITSIIELISNHTNSALQRQKFLENNNKILRQEINALTTLSTDSLKLAILADTIKKSQQSKPGAMRAIADTIIKHLSQNLPKAIAVATHKQPQACFIKPRVIENLSHFVETLLTQKIPSSAAETNNFFETIRKKLIKNMNRKISLNNAIKKSMAILSQTQENAIEEIKRQLLTNLSKFPLVKFELLRQLYIAKSAVILYEKNIGNNPRQSKENLKTDLPRKPFSLAFERGSLAEVMPKLLGANIEQTAAWTESSSYGKVMGSEANYQQTIQPMLNNEPMLIKAWEWNENHYTQTMLSIGQELFHDAIINSKDHELVKKYLLSQDEKAIPLRKWIKLETWIKFLFDDESQVSYIIVMHQIIGFEDAATAERISLLPESRNMFSMAYEVTEEGVKLAAVDANSPGLLEVLTKGNVLPWLYENAAYFIGAEANALACGQSLLASQSQPSHFCDRSELPFADIQTQILYWLANAGEQGMDVLTAAIKADPTMYQGLNSTTVDAVIKIDNLRPVTSILLGLFNTNAGCALLLKNPEWLLSVTAEHLMIIDAEHAVQPLGLTRLAKNELGPQVFNHIVKSHPHLFFSIQSYLSLIFTTADNYDTETILDIVLLLLSTESFHEMLKYFLNFEVIADSVSKKIGMAIAMGSYPYQTLLLKIFTCDATFVLAKNILSENLAEVNQLILNESEFLLKTAGPLIKLMLVKALSTTEAGLNFLKSQFEKDTKFFDFIFLLPADSHNIHLYLTPLLFSTLPASAGAYQHTSLFCWLANQPHGVLKLLELFQRYLPLYPQLTPAILIAAPTSNSKVEIATPALFQFAQHEQTQLFVFASLLSLLLKEQDSADDEALISALCIEYAKAQSTLSYLAANRTFHENLLKFIQAKPMLIVNLLANTSAVEPRHHILYKRNFDNWVYGVIPDLAATDEGKQILLWFMLYRPTLSNEIDNTQIKNILHRIAQTTTLACPKTPTEELLAWLAEYRQELVSDVTDKPQLKELLLNTIMKQLTPPIGEPSSSSSSNLVPEVKNEPRTPEKERSMAPRAPTAFTYVPGYSLSQHFTLKKRKIEDVPSSSKTPAAP